MLTIPDGKSFNKLLPPISKDAFDLMILTLNGTEFSLLSLTAQTCPFCEKTTRQKIYSHERTTLDPLIWLPRHLRRQCKKNYTLNPKQIETKNSTNDPDINTSSPSITFVNVSSLLSLLNRKRLSLRSLAAIKNAKKSIQQFDDNLLANTTQMINSTLNRFKPSICIDYCVLNQNEDN
jgi:hypothetical protein